MNKEYNIYCDESCHLEHDKHNFMLIGAIWCSKDKVETLSKEIRKLKQKYRAKGELKWVKVSESRIDFYLELKRERLGTDTC